MTTITSTPILLETGNIVRTYRKLRHWSQAELAEGTGLSIATIQSIELGRRGAAGETLRRIVTALHIPPDVLGFGGNGNGNGGINGDGLTPDDYEKILASCWTLFYSGNTNAAIPTVKVCLKALGKGERRALAMLGRFHQIAGVLARDGRDVQTAMLHGVMAVDVARQVGQIDAIAASLFRLARTYQQFDRNERALELIREAHALAPQCRNPLRGWLSVIRVEIESKTGVGQPTEMRRHIDHALSDLANRPGQDDSFTALTKSGILMAECVALVLRGEPMRVTVPLITLAQKELAPGDHRWRASMQAVESMAYAVGGEAQAAADMATEVCAVTSAHSHMRYLRTGYAALQNNARLRNNPATARMGVLLQGR